VRVLPPPLLFQGHRNMAKSLHRMTKAELISTVQDYQEMVSEIEEVINRQVEKPESLLQIREIMTKYLMGTTETQEGGAI